MAAKRIRKPLKKGEYDPTEGGRLCGARRKSRKERYCRRQAGFNTDHPGQGRCHLHGGRRQGASAKGASPFVHPYNSIIHERLTDKWNLLAKAEYNVLDLIPEANLLRVLIVDFINRYEDMSQALLRWHAGITNTKPRRVMDIADAYRMIDSLGKVVERIHKMRQEGAISLETFRRVTEAMGIVVTKHISDHETLANIEREWNMIAIDAKRPEPVVNDAEDGEDSDDEEWES